MRTRFKTLPDLETLVDFVVSKYKPEKIILFGSYATKTERKNKAAAEIWLNKAKDHLTFATAGWEESEIVSDTCVLCQQAAENHDTGRTLHLRCRNYNP